MKLLSTILFLVSFTAHAALPSAVPSVTVSAPGANTGQVSISPSQLASNGSCGSAANSPCFSLYGGSGSGSGTAAHFYPLYQNGLNGGTSGYRVSSGKTAYCFDITAAGGTGGALFQFVSDTAVIAGGANGTTTLTAGVYQGGAAAAYTNIANPTNSGPIVIPGTYTFGSLTYVGVQISASVTYQIHLDCFEQ